jgi:hypothetical protein
MEVKNEEAGKQFEKHMALPFCEWKCAGKILKNVLYTTFGKEKAQK